MDEKDYVLKVEVMYKTEQVAKEGKQRERSEVAVGIKGSGAKRSIG
jgi:hypothetical protein